MKPTPGIQKVGDRCLLRIESYRVAVRACENRVAPMLCVCVCVYRSVSPFLKHLCVYIDMPGADDSSHLLLEENVFTVVND